MKVFKYKFNPTAHVSIMLPRGAQILSVQFQCGEFCLWALVDPDAQMELRNFLFAGTGEELFEAPENLQFIETLQMEHRSLLRHFFEITIKGK